ncbi:MAG: hypothetical protein U0169_09195 [Polyangiaceae bacterium]
MVDLGKVFGIQVEPTSGVTLLVADVSTARAYFEGVPAARLLARTRLARDAHDLDVPEDAAFVPRVTFDLIVKSIVSDGARRDEVAKAIARHTRAAWDEGPLVASDTTVSTLVRACATGADPDASLSEIVGSPEAPPASAAFDACVHVAATGHVGPFAEDRLRALFAQLDLALGTPTPFVPLPTPLYPRTLDAGTAPNVTRMAVVDRAPLDGLVARDPRDLAAAIARKSGTGSRSIPPPSALTKNVPSVDAFVADLTRLLRNPGALVLASSPAWDAFGADDSGSTRGARNPSWLPHDWSNPAGAIALAEALEHGATTVPRIRWMVSHGGDDALEAVGSEMLRVAAHPFASAAFAEVLASSGRPRDVMRLVTYFALAPDPIVAARALAGCSAPELPRLLAAWLESMLPPSGEATTRGDDPDRSSGARLTACIHALEPYPHLHAAASPLLRRVSDAPASS